MPSKTIKSVEVPDRADVLIALWDSAKWLKDKTENTRTKLDANFRQRVYCMQVHAQICKALLYGLKDETTELRLKELEKKTENGVFIPYEQKR